MNSARVVAKRCVTPSMKACSSSVLCCGCAVEDAAGAACAALSAGGGSRSRACSRACKVRTHNVSARARVRRVRGARTKELTTSDWTAASRALTRSASSSRLRATDNGSSGCVREQGVDRPASSRGGELAVRAVRRAAGGAAGSAASCCAAPARTTTLRSALTGTTSTGTGVARPESPLSRTSLRDLIRAVAQRQDRIL